VVGNHPDLAPLAAAHGVAFERVLLHGRRTVIFQ
jgi:hypothetical protein